jgi:hypothetical protein
MEQVSRRAKRATEYVWDRAILFLCEPYEYGIDFSKPSVLIVNTNSLSSRR